MNIIKIGFAGLVLFCANAGILSTSLTAINRINGEKIAYQPIEKVLITTDGEQDYVYQFRSGVMAQFAITNMLLTLYLLIKFGFICSNNSDDDDNLKKVPVRK